MTNRNYWVNAEKAILMKNRRPNGKIDYETAQQQLSAAGYQRTLSALYLYAFRQRIKKIQK